MNCYDFTLADRILLLGEGNFTFSLSLINYLKPRLSDFHYSSFYSTCFETELSTDTKKNIEELQTLGVHVLTGVDATSLSSFKELNGDKFSKIIFNFPHVGGKMKIHRNRQLIRDFFISSRSLLKDEGQIIVGLCAGQGGTGAETVSRRYDDTWKIVEMAAHADYTLITVDKFPANLFDNYISYGFRGIAKSFRTDDALIHIFKISPILPNWNLNNETFSSIYMGMHKLPGVESLEVPFVFSELFDRRKNSPQEFVCQKLANEIGNFSLVQKQNLPYFLTGSLNDHSICISNGQEFLLRQSLIEVIDKNYEDDYISDGIVFSSLSSSFAVCPVKCEFLAHISNCKSVVSTVIEVILFYFNIKKFQLEWAQEEAGHSSLTLSNDIKCSIAEVHTSYCKHGKEYCIIDVDALCLFIFNLQNNKQLWSSSRSFSFQVSPPILQCSIYPPQFIFDINLIKSPSFSFDKLRELFWQVGNLMIENTFLLNSFEHPGTGDISYCFRITYKSYDFPLHRKKAVEFHEKVIGTSLKMAFNVIIT